MNVVNNPIYIIIIYIIILCPFVDLFDALFCVRFYVLVALFYAFALCMLLFLRPLQRIFEAPFFVSCCPIRLSILYSILVPLVAPFFD